MESNWEDAIAFVPFQTHKLLILSSELARSRFGSMKECNGARGSA
ncbi:hypothetical protein [Coleofasciculus sp. FACHB-1120]|nr:hypothetical protein [Coleofasciculus sp. FACHB-1120]